MKLDTIEKLTEEIAKKLVGKHIHFTWHNKEDNTMETMPGKVLDYNNKMLKIDTLDIIYADTYKEVSNKLIKEINIDDLSDVLTFEEYTKEFWNILDSITEEELEERNFEISDVFGNTFTTRILDNDSLSITILCNDEPYDYPLYFVKSINIID